MFCCEGETHQIVLAKGILKLIPDNSPSFTKLFLIDLLVSSSLALMRKHATNAIAIYVMIQWMNVIELGSAEHRHKQD